MDFTSDVIMTDIDTMTRFLVYLTTEWTRIGQLKELNGTRYGLSHGCHGVASMGTFVGWDTVVKMKIGTSRITKIGSLVLLVCRRLKARQPWQLKNWPQPMRLFLEGQLRVLTRAEQQLHCLMVQCRLLRL